MFVSFVSKPKALQGFAGSASFKCQSEFKSHFPVSVSIIHIFFPDCGIHRFWSFQCNAPQLNIILHYVYHPSSLSFFLSLSPRSPLFLRLLSPCITLYFNLFLSATFFLLSPQLLIQSLFLPPAVQYLSLSLTSLVLPYSPTRLFPSHFFPFIHVSLSQSFTHNPLSLLTSHLTFTPSI